MAQGLQHYPPSVTDAPSGLTAPRPAYLFAALVVLLSLFAYLVVYLALIVAAAWLTFQIAVT